MVNLLAASSLITPSASAAVSDADPFTSRPWSQLVCGSTSSDEVRLAEEGERGGSRRATDCTRPDGGVRKAAACSARTASNLHLVDIGVT
jgi:hypothetical protein